MLEGCGPDSIKKQDSCWFRAPAGYMKFHVLRRDQGDVNPWRFIMGAKRGNKRKRRLVCVADKDVGGCPGLFCCVSISAELLTSGSAHRALRLKRGGTCGHSTKNCWDSHFPHILARFTPSFCHTAPKDEDFIDFCASPHRWILY